MRGSLRIGSVAPRRRSILRSSAIDQGSAAYVDAHDAMYASTSLRMTLCVVAMWLAAATSMARRAAARIDSSATSLVAAKPQPLPTSTRAPAELLAEARLEALHARLVGAGEDADELAAAVVADDVLLPAELRERLVELRVLVVGLDPVDGERLVELRHRVDVAAQPLVELG